MIRLGDVARLVERHRSRIDALPVTRSVIVLSNYCLAMLMMCRMKDGLFAAKQAMELASRLGDDAANAYARAAVIMSSCILGQGDLDNIQRQVELGLQESERTDDGYLRSWIYLAAAWGYLELGLIDRARALALELQARGHARGDPRPAATFSTWYRAADKRSVTGSALAGRDFGGRVRLPFTANRNGRIGTHPPKCCSGSPSLENT